MILHIPGVLNPQQLTTCRELLRQADWVDGNATSGQQAAQAKRNRQLADGSPLSRQLGDMVLDALARNPLYISAVLPLRMVPPLFNRYEGGEHFRNHVDNAIRRLRDSGQTLRTDVSSTLFLSDPADYDGGELVIQDTYGTHEVKLPAGDLVVYPATSLHRVEPVTRGLRLSSFFWAQSTVRDDWQRTLLFDLDTTIQKLRHKLGDNEETVALTSHYHNLLRQWAEL